MDDQDPRKDAPDWLVAELEDAIDEDLELEFGDAALSLEIKRIYKDRHRDWLAREIYFPALIRLQSELIRMHHFVERTGAKVLVLFEARGDVCWLRAASSKRITASVLSTRTAASSALCHKPAERAAAAPSWSTFQRTFPGHLPADAAEHSCCSESAGCLQRAGVRARSMGFCLERQ